MSSCLVVSQPNLADLAKYVTPRYSSYWKKIGIHLNVEKGRLNAIECDYKYVDRCCDQMFALWRDTDHNATWSKVFDAIESACKYSMQFSFVVKSVYISILFI